MYVCVCAKACVCVCVCIWCRSHAVLWRDAAVLGLFVMMCRETKLLKVKNFLKALNKKREILIKCPLGERTQSDPDISVWTKCLGDLDFFVCFFLQILFVV